MALGPKPRLLRSLRPNNPAPACTIVNPREALSRICEKLREQTSAAEAEDPGCQIFEDAVGECRAKWHPAQASVPEPGMQCLPPYVHDNLLTIEQDDELNAIRKQSRDAFLQASEDGNLERAPLGGSGCFRVFSREMSQDRLLKACKLQAQHAKWAAGQSRCFQLYVAHCSPNSPHKPKDQLAKATGAAPGCHGGSSLGVALRAFCNPRTLHVCRSHWNQSKVLASFLFLSNQEAASKELTEAEKEKASSSLSESCCLFPPCENKVVNNAASEIEDIQRCTAGQEGRHPSEGHELSLLSNFLGRAIKSR